MDLDLKVGSTGNFIVTDDVGYMMIEAALTSQGAYQWNINNGENSLKFGYESMVYKGLNIVYDRYMPDSRIYMLSLDDFKLDEGFKGGWDTTTDENGQSLRLKDGYNIFESRMEYLGNIECTRPDRQGMIYNFPTAVA
jgi:hypothetical protein